MRSPCRVGHSGKAGQTGQAGWSGKAEQSRKVLFLDRPALESDAKRPNMDLGAPQNTKPMPITLSDAGPEEPLPQVWQWPARQYVSIRGP